MELAVAGAGVAVGLARSNAIEGWVTRLAESEGESVRGRADACLSILAAHSESTCLGMSPTVDLRIVGDALDRQRLSGCRYRSGTKAHLLTGGRVIQSQLHAGGFVGPPSHRANWPLGQWASGPPKDSHQMGGMVALGEVIEPRLG